MASIEIRDANENDVSSITDLLNQVDSFYGDVIQESPSDRAKIIQSILFGPRPSSCALLAWDNDQAVGFASYTFLWPATGSTCSLYLKEIYVVDGYRGLGIGRDLMNALFKLAEDKGCSRVEWTTDKSNLEAQKFYDKIDGTICSSKIMYRRDLAQ